MQHEVAPGRVEEHDPSAAMPMAMTMEVEPKNRVVLRKLHVGETIDATADASMFPGRRPISAPSPHAQPRSSAARSAPARPAGRVDRASVRSRNVGPGPPRSNQTGLPRVVGGMRFDVKLVIAIGTVWLLWGSTFAGMHYAVATIPPFAMAAARFLLAGGMLYCVCAARGRARATRADLTHAVISGAALLLFGNGMTAYTVQFLPTGINALLLSSAPIWMALIGFVWGGERVRAIAVAGMILGLAGLAVLVQPHAGGALPLRPVLIAVFASIAWSFGSIYGRRVGKPADVMLATALQMLAGGALLALEATLTGEWRTLDVRAISAASLAGFGWLVVFGSIIAYSAYQYTMHAANTALASTYAYVNPIVSVILGYLLFGERLTPGQGLASAVIIAGVALMMWPDDAASRRVRPCGTVTREAT